MQLLASNGTLASQQIQQLRIDALHLETAAVLQRKLKLPQRKSHLSLVILWGWIKTYCTVRDEHQFTSYILFSWGLLRCRHSGLLCRVQHLELQCWLVRLCNPLHLSQRVVPVAPKNRDGPRSQLMLISCRQSKPETSRDSANICRSIRIIDESYCGRGMLLWISQSSLELAVELHRRQRWEEEQRTNVCVIMWNIL